MVLQEVVAYAIHSSMKSESKVFIIFNLKLGKWNCHLRF
jgi:hypothetical protein